MKHNIGPIIIYVFAGFALLGMWQITEINPSSSKYHDYDVNEPMTVGINCHGNSPEV